MKVDRVIIEGVRFDVGTYHRASIHIAFENDGMVSFSSSRARPGMPFGDTMYHFKIHEDELLKLQEIMEICDE